MSVSILQPLPQTTIWDDDPLMILPRKRPQYFQKDEIIYASEDHAGSIFLVVSGTVKLSRISETGRETVLDFLGDDEFFGETAMQRRGIRGESAVALEAVTVMEWSLDDLSRIMMRSPELGGTLLRVMADKASHAHARIESMAIDQISQRLIKALIRLGEEFGDPGLGTSVHLMPITHELLAKYVGTSREIVTQHMSQLRKKSLVNYDRAGLDFDPVELKKQIVTR